MQFGNIMFCVALVCILIVEGGLGLLGYSDAERNAVLYWAFLAWLSFSVGGCIAIYRNYTPRARHDDEIGPSSPSS